MTSPGGKTAPPPVDNLKLPRTEYIEWCYHLPDTCFESITPRSRRKLKYSIFNIYTCFDVIKYYFPIIIHVIVICILVIIKNVIHHATVEPLTNDHPHQRPSLSYDHISCDGQWFLSVYESLTSDHPSYTTTPM